MGGLTFKFCYQPIMSPQNSRLTLMATCCKPDQGQCFLAVRCRSSRIQFCTTTSCRSSSANLSMMKLLLLRMTS